MDAGLLEALRKKLAARVPARLTLLDVLLRPAAVLIPLYVRDDEVWVVLTERRKDLRAHAGQISFPGGSADAADASIKHTALREAFEEVGIRQEHVDVLGELDEFPTVTRFKINPFVGVIPYPYSFVPNEREVSQLIQAPLSAFVAPGVLTTQQAPIPFLGRYRTIYSYQIGLHRVWGATAAILKELLDIISVLQSGMTARS